MLVMQDINVKIYEVTYFFYLLFGLEQNVRINLLISM